MSKLSRLLLIVLAGTIACAATSSAQARCHKHWDRHSQKWTTHCAQNAPPVVSPDPAEPASVPPPPGPIGRPPNTDPTDPYWFDPQD
ncbi:MAG: hypothetical protein WAK01_09940 [Methylocystis sp.]